MKRVCAWCNKLLGSITCPGADDDIITHSICPDCVNNLEFQLGVTLATFLDSMPVPVIMVDSTARVVAASRQAINLIDADTEEFQGKLLGQVFECAHARLPEGCGKTIHCSGCVIRNSVRHTFETGESLEHVPAHISRGTAQQNRPAEMFISTRKQESVVLLSLIWNEPGQEKK